MADTLREAPLGQLLRFITGNRVLQYPEEKPGFELPAEYNAVLNASTSEKRPSIARGPTVQSTPSADTRQSSLSGEEPSELEKVETEAVVAEGDKLSLKKTKSRLDTVPYTEDRLEIEAELAIERTQTKPIAPVKTADGKILVDWYTTDDPANPQNWSNGKRLSVSILICTYTFVVYNGSAIYTASIEGVIEKWGVSPAEASLPLSMYVLGYGIGPLLWAPLSEIPIIGRSPVYAATMAIFTILSLPTAMVDNFAGLVVLRFLQGFFGSPCLAIGAATMQDIYTLLYLPYALVAWVSAAYCGPALGPLLSGFAVTAKGWRWSLWEILWMAGPMFLVMFFVLPETSTPNILLRRATRLRALTGDNRLASQSEIDQKKLSPSAILIDAIVKPIEITIKDPAILFVNVYTAIIYGMYYSIYPLFQHLPSAAV
jgi:DHA1 family multidrug resistance protein-like MFS transporter